MTKPPAGPPPPDNEPDDAGDRTEPHGAGDGHSDEARSELFSNGFPTFGLSAAPIPDPTILIGHTIDGYTLTRVLGQGGMGWVFEADQGMIDKPVALKICKPGTDHRLVKEANILKELKHDGIAKIYRGGEVDSRFGRLTYIATELVPEGRHLDEYCRLNQLDLQSRIRLLSEVCDALAYAHTEKNVIHRDLKSSNILVDSEGRAKVIDFGIARFSSNGTGRSTTLTAAGTPGRMPPEQENGSELTPASDVYALGMILHDLACNRLSRPSSDDDQPAECTDDPLVPWGLQRIIDRCRKIKPGDRYPDAGHLGRSLRRWLDWHLPDWLDWRKVTRTGGLRARATGRWLHAHRRHLAGGGLAAAVAAALAWAAFIRPDMPAFARAVAAASAASTSATEADGTRAIAEAGRIWRLARPFARSQPLEIVCLAGRNARDEASRLVAAAAQTMAVSGGAQPLAAVGYPGGVALLDPTRSDRQLICRLGSSAPISTVTFSADGSRLFAGDEAGRVLVWDTARLLGTPIDSTPRRVDLNASAAAAVLAIDVPSASTATARWCLALDATGRIFRVDAAGNQTGPEASLVATIPDAHDIALLDSGRLLAVATDTGYVEFRDLRQPSTVLRTETVGPAPIDLARDRDGRSLYAVSPRQLALWSNPRSTAAATASLPAGWEGTTPRVVTATADACLIARQIDGEASLHCFRDVRGRLNPLPCWQETLTLRSPTRITAAAMIPGEPLALAVLDARGFLTTGR